LELRNGHVGPNEHMGGQIECAARHMADAPHPGPPYTLGKPGRDDAPMLRIRGRRQRERVSDAMGHEATTESTQQHSEEEQQDTLRVRHGAPVLKS